MGHRLSLRKANTAHKAYELEDDTETAGLDYIEHF
jgi:hypothetical protein